MLKCDIKNDTKIVILLFTIAFIVFVFSSDGHRYTSDEDWAQLQSIRIATLTPHPLWEEGKTRTLFEHPDVYPPEFRTGNICTNAILCSPATVGHSLTEAPFLLINKNFHIISESTVNWTINDFRDAHYVMWRNSIDPNFTFLELFYGPFFSSISVMTFFLICKTFKFSLKTSLILSLIFALGTTIWSYSQTSLNVVPTTSLILISFLFFRKFQNDNKMKFLIFSGITAGFGFLVREDTILFIVPIFVLLFISFIRKKIKMRDFLSYVFSVIPFYFIIQEISRIRFGTEPSQSIQGVGASVSLVRYINLEWIFGLLLSPGVGLFIFAPILLTCFFSFSDFFSKNRSSSILLLSIITSFVLYYGSFFYWHGLVAWGSRYTVEVVAFLLIPLGVSLDKRKSRSFKILIFGLFCLGLFFNLANITQDVSWFVWGRPGYELGLFSLGKAQTDLYIHEATKWSFEYSQLTHSIINMLYSLQPDLYLLKLFGGINYTVILTLLILPQSWYLYRIIIKLEKP